MPARRQNDAPDGFALTADWMLCPGVIETAPAGQAIVGCGPRPPVGGGVGDDGETTTRTFPGGGAGGGIWACSAEMATSVPTTAAQQWQDQSFGRSCTGLPGPSQESEGELTGTLQNAVRSRRVAEPSEKGLKSTIGSALPQRTDRKPRVSITKW